MPEHMRKSKEEIQQLARKTLVEHGLMTIPVNPVLVAGRLGIRAVYAAFKDPRSSGLAARRGDGLLVLVKESEAPVRKRFTLAHEIGHCLLHLYDGLGEILDTDADFFRTTAPHSDEWTDRRYQEIEANIFASELLMPRDMVVKVWIQLPAGQRTIPILAGIFQVSEEAMGYKVDELSGVLRE